MQNGVEALLAIVIAEEYEQPQTRLCAICNEREIGWVLDCCEEPHCPKCLSVLI